MAAVGGGGWGGGRRPDLDSGALVVTSSHVWSSLVEDTRGIMGEFLVGDPSLIRPGSSGSVEQAPFKNTDLSSYLDCSSRPARALPIEILNIRSDA